MSHLSPLHVAATYAIGDLHGEVTLLQRLLAELPLREQDTLVFLGDYLDRGEDSAALVTVLRELSVETRKALTPALTLMTTP